jgi:serine protease Do
MKRFLLFVMVVAIFLAGLYAWTRHRRSQSGWNPAGKSAPLIDRRDVRVLSAIDEENTRVVDAVLPSVVSITSSRQVSTGMIDLREFLINHQLRPVLQNLQALGSGFIVSSEGHILTNYHVVADTSTIQVQLNDGQVVSAQVIGTDPDTDIAVLKIDATNLKPLPLGNSDDVKVGESVFAVGNPFGLQGTVTHGIISAKSRVVDDTTLEYLQTDAPINEGNSGGPLVDLRGEVIGINTRIASQAQGLSFAIPSNVARRTFEAIREHGSVVHSYLGVKLDGVPAQYAAQFGVDPAKVALVVQVYSGSPAEQAGLRAGDIIMKFNGQDFNGKGDLRDRLIRTPVGATITLGVVHPDRQTATITAQITARPH